MFGLKKNDIDNIISIVQGFNVVEQALIFGSRAMGNYKKGSDIDIAIKGDSIDYKITSQIAYLLNEETLMPYFFDVVHYNSLKNENLVDHIDRVGVVFYEQQKN